MRHRPQLVRLVGTAAASAGLILGLSPGAVSAQSETDDPAQLEAGEAVFVESCAGCHGDDGMGTDFGRPLTGIAGQEPDRLVHIASVTDGKGDMPAFGDALSVDDIDAAVTYARLTFVSEQDAATLPRTGPSEAIALVGGAFLVGGAALTEFVRRRRPEPV